MSERPSLTPPELLARVREVEDRIRLAHQAGDRGDAAACGWRARTALEAMLQLQCDAEGVAVRVPAGKPVTVEVLRVALRHARLLPRRTEDHVAHVQNIGNRAAHGTVGPEQAVGPEEARAALMALDLVWRDLQGGLVPATAPPPLVELAEDPVAPRLPAVVLSLAVGLLAASVAFVVAWAAFAWLDTPTEASAGTAPTVEPALVDAQQLEALLADTDPPADSPYERVVGHVRAHQALRPDELIALSCRELQWARNWVWAAQGYAFEGAEARAFFATAPGYVAWKGTARRAVEQGFSEVDWANLDTLTDTMLGRDCGCVRPARRRVPCPE